ncbi:galactose-3-O-sulfotransferase 2-like [Watersipora subatra]|uniref:galactose-3-O-sulfotransferase 2-like n=1 Tax=Watersipora subatra TaxID=2589382 RepID=UPI00355C9258
MKRMKIIIQILVVFFILDCIYLYRKYHEYTDISSKKSKVWSMSRLKSAMLVEKFVKKDLILTVRQANSIINPDRLKSLQTSTQHNPNATDTILFLKTHKTGSSTLQNILLRYFLLHNLTIALPAYRASFFWPNPFSAKLFVKKQPGISRYHGFAHHAIYNKQEMLNVMKPNPSFITILRDPIALFKSAYKYYNMQSYCFNTTVERIKFSPNYKTFKTGVCPMTRTPVRNLQAFDLGLSLFNMDKEEAIKLLIQDIDQTMTVVLITERFDESLILLKKIFNWTMDDIVYFKQNAQDPKLVHPVQVTNEADNDILQFNYADYLIYSHFSQKLDRQLKEHFNESQLQKELQMLHELQAEHQRNCVQQMASANSSIFLSRSSSYSLFRPYGGNTLGYVLKPNALQDVNCRLLAMPELTLTHYIKAMAPRVKEGWLH